MSQDNEKLNEAVNAQEPEEEILEPTSKYERIMVAALEATRLNEEIRRKGIKLPHKVTTEAMNRVRDGKVKAVVTRPSSMLEEPLPVVPPEPTRDSFFSTPPPEAEPAGEAKGDESGDKSSSD